MSACIFSVGSSIFNIEANAVTTDKAVVEQKEGVDDSEDEIMPMVAGIVTVSSKSGANIRTDAGTSYSKIPPAAAYGKRLIIMENRRQELMDTLGIKLCGMEKLVG